MKDLSRFAAPVQQFAAMAGRLFVVAALACTAAGAAQNPLAHIVLSSTSSARPAAPQEQSFYYHYEWTQGAVVTPEEWKRGAAVSPGSAQLELPPGGYEWREIDSNYVLASKSTHAIHQVVAAPHPTIPGHSGGEP